MGPEASAEFHRQLVRRNPATSDQEHFRILVLDDPHIPDRTSFILDSGEDPRPALQARAAELESFGASFISIPCNTAHAFWKEIQSAVSIPVLHIVEVTIASIVQPDGTIAVLATRGTIAAGLYERALKRGGWGVLLPDERLQQRVDSVIDGAKKAGDRTWLSAELKACCDSVVRQGADAAILGCTELGMQAEEWDVPPLPLYDSVAALAEATLAKARELEHGSGTRPSQQPLDSPSHSS